MLRVLFKVLLLTNVGLSFFVLSGCFRETALLSAIDIRNELKYSVHYCSSFELPSCEREVKAGEVSREYYIEHGSEYVYNPALFDSLWVSLCGAPVRLDRIRNVSPVVEKEERTFEVVIDKKVYREFCSH